MFKPKKDTNWFQNSPSCVDIWQNTSTILQYRQSRLPPIQGPYPTRKVKCAYKLDITVQFVCHTLGGYEVFVYILVQSLLTIISIKDK